MNCSTDCRHEEKALQKRNWRSAICDVLFSYVINKTGIFPKSVRNKYLFWANY